MASGGAEDAEWRDGMRTVVTRPIEHMCPHVPEHDVGTLTMEFDGPAPELHALAAYIDAWAPRSITHEALTHRIAEDYPGAKVETQWVTAGMTVLVTARVDP